MGALIGPARADKGSTNYIWQGTSTAWSNTANWSPSGVPGTSVSDSTSVSAEFSDLAFPTYTTAQITGNYYVAALTFNYSSAQTSFVVSAASAGDVLDIGSSGTIGIVDTYTVTETISAPVNLGATATPITVASGGTIAMSGAVTGSGATLNGAGTVLMTGTNTYTGTTTISSGTLQLGDGSTEATGGTSGGSLTGSIVNNSSLVFDLAGAGQTYGGAISGSGNLTLNVGSSYSSAILTLTGANTYSGATIVHSGVLYLGNSTLTGSLGTGAVSINTGSAVEFNLTSSAGSNSIVNAGTLDFNDSSSAGSATISNTGAMAFLNTSTPGSATIVNNGTLDFSNHNGEGVSISELSGSGNVDIGVVDLTVGSANTSDTLSGSISGGLDAVMTKMGTGTLTLTGGNAYNKLAIISGTVQIGDGVSTSTTFGANSINDNTSVIFDTASNGLSVSASISGSGTLTKNGSGTLTLSGGNQYTGGTIVNSGTLLLASNAAISNGKLSLNGGGLQTSLPQETVSNAVTINGNVALNSGTITSTSVHTEGLALSGAVTLNCPSNSVTLDVTGSTRVGITGVIGETSGQPDAIVKNGSGALEFDNDNSYSGGTLVAAGTLVVDNNFGRTAHGSGTGQGAVTVASGATLMGAFVITGPVQIDAGGTLTIGDNGSGGGNGFANGVYGMTSGDSAGGDIATSTISFLTLAGGSTLSLDPGSDELDVTSLLTMDGTGGIVLDLAGESPSAGTFTLLTFGAESGISTSDFFATGLPAGWNYAFTLTSPRGSNNGMLSVTLSQAAGAAAAPEPSALALFALPGVLWAGHLARSRRQANDQNGATR